MIDNTAIVLSTLTTAGGILTLIVQQYFAGKAADRRAQEQRLQTMADTELAKAESTRLAAELALESEKRAELLRQMVETASRVASANTRRVTTKLDENTALTVEVKAAATAAFAEANNVNRKIAEIGLQVKDGTPLSGSSDH